MKRPYIPQALAVASLAAIVLAATAASAGGWVRDSSIDGPLARALWHCVDAVHGNPGLPFDEQNAAFALCMAAQGYSQRNGTSAASKRTMTLDEAARLLNQPTAEAR